ncbi:MAG: alpha/beta fold hydrolase [Thermoleophilaceae bacterium]
MPHADLNGQRIHYDVHGDGEPLLCVHGLGVDRRGWALQVQPWSQHHKVVVFDNRDVGESSYATAEYETSDMALDTLALADHLELETFDLVGISLGGMVAQHVALTEPERLRSLSLCFTHGGTGRYGQLRGRLLGESMRGLTPEERIDQLMLLCYTEDFFENKPAVEWLRNALLEDPHPQDPDGFARQAAAGGRHDVRNRLDTLTMPVHVIGAARDILIPVWKSEELAALIPGAKLTVMDDAGHGALWEKADDFNQAVLSFLAAAAAEAVR